MQRDVDLTAEVIVNAENVVRVMQEIFNEAYDDWQGSVAETAVFRLMMALAHYKEATSGTSIPP